VISEKRLHIFTKNTIIASVFELPLRQEEENRILHLGSDRGAVGDVFPLSEVLRQDATKIM
jgi:hypothetical protein